MYQYDQIDQTLVDERVTQYRDQVARRLSGELAEEEFRPLRLQNGLYMQRHAYMLRVAIPYGLLSSKQLHMLAHIADHYDRGYGHFTTRQNIQYNWLSLEDSPNILAELATVEMHAIQTSGNCVRNITSDPFAGVAADEEVDPRPISELLRQWSTFHPEFAHLPRKFKVAINGASEDRAVILAHDIGLRLRKNGDDNVVVDVVVGGGMGRTPVIGKVIREALPWQDLPDYFTAILRVYNLYGRRDNMYKARIKILVNALGVEEFTRQVEALYAQIEGQSRFTEAELARVAAHFVNHAYKTLPRLTPDALIAKHEAAGFARWLERNTREHRVDGYVAVVLSLKPHHGAAPGDATGAQMHTLADLADEFSLGEIRVTHEQNLVFADVEQQRVFELWQRLKALNLTTPNIGLLTDVIACPGGDFCSLANARSIPVAQAIQQKFADLDQLFDLGDISLNISGCINSCGHHHVGNIGILGVDKDGKEFYQITLGGAQGNDAQIGKVIGPAFSAEEVPEVIGKILQVYQSKRQTEKGFTEKMVDTVHRLGLQPFKEAVYAA